MEAAIWVGIHATTGEGLWVFWLVTVGNGMVDYLGGAGASSALDEWFVQRAPPRGSLSPSLDLANYCLTGWGIKDGPHKGENPWLKPSFEGLSNSIRAGNILK